MKTVMVILIVAMIAKDASQLNDPYIMRGLAQGLCLLFGLGGIAASVSSSFLKLYWPLLGYLLFIFVSGVFSSSATFALIQATSLMAVILFFIAYYNKLGKNEQDPNKIVFNTIVIAYSIASIISVLMAKINPSLAYGVVGEYMYTTEVRFKGLFPGAGSMAASAGLLIGFVLLRKGSWWWRVPVLLSAIICLYLTQSRTFWVALIAGLILTWWIYYPHKRGLSMLTLVLAIPICITVFLAFNVQLETKGMEKTARLESISNLSGRMDLWKVGFESAQNRPLIGYGLTMGSLALHDNSGKNTSINSSRKADDRSVGRTTLHNGYMQSLLDIGIFGTFFYLSVFFVSLKRLIKQKENREYAPVFFGITFLAISNLGENVIYGASVYHAILFWCLVTFCLQLPKTKKFSES